MSSEPGKYEVCRVSLRVIVIITAEHLLCVDILTHSIPVTQSDTFFYVKKWLVNT